jgi:hypothetical protein
MGYGRDTERTFANECFQCNQMEAATHTGMGYGWDTDGIRQMRMHGRSSMHSPLRMSRPYPIRIPSLYV